MAVYLGIDPGTDGGLGLINAESEVIAALVMPQVAKGTIDMVVLAGIIWEWRKEHGRIEAFLELVSARPGQGVSSTFKFGVSYGAAQMALAAYKVPHTLVTPAQWSRTMFAGVAGKLEAKDRSRVAAARLFPSVDLRRSDKGKKPHDGICDALLIAEWGRRRRLIEGL